MAQVLSFKRMIARFKLDNLTQWDTVLCIDGAESCRHGPVGLGKTAVASQILLSLHPHATIASNMVIKNDEEHYLQLLKRKDLFVPIAVDEAENWWYKRTAMHGKQKNRVIEFMSNRKELKFHILVLPRIWDMDEYLRKERIQWRLRVEKRGEVSLHVRDSPSNWDKKKDKWGRHEGTFFDVPMPPHYVWREYHRCLDAYKPAEWDGVGIKAELISPARRAKDVWGPEHPLSPTGYINPAQPEGGGR